MENDDSVCYHCFSAPCVISPTVFPDFVRGSAALDPSNVVRRYRLYTKFWSHLRRLGLWDYPPYKARKRRMGHENSPRDIIPWCVKTMVRERFPNPPYKDHLTRTTLPGPPYQDHLTRTTLPGPPYQDHLTRTTLPGPPYQDHLTRTTLPGPPYQDHLTRTTLPGPPYQDHLTRTTLPGPPYQDHLTSGQQTYKHNRKINHSQCIVYVII